MSMGSVIRSIENLSQSVAALFGNLAAFTSTYATTLINTIELIKSDVSALSLTLSQKNEILNVLNQAENIIISARNVGFITIEQLNTILELLQLAVLKVESFIIFS